MLQLRAVPAGKLAQRADLVDDVVDDLLARAVNPAAPKTLKVPVSRVSADPHAMLGGQAHRCIHQIGIAGMKSGCYVG